MGRTLMCRPDRLSVHFLLNPWMDWTEEIDIGRARDEWEGLRRRLEEAGRSIDLIDQHPSAGAMTFTRDAFVELGDETVVLVNDGPRGEVEPIVFAAWLRKRGRRVRWPPLGRRLDGGNVLRCADGRWLIGIEPSGEKGSERWLGKLVRERQGAEAIAVPLADVRYLHLDMVLADLGGRGWLVHRAGFAQPDLDDPSWGPVLDGRPVIEVEVDDARELACNVVVTDDVVVGGSMSDGLAHAIEKLGLSVVRTPLDEFRKAGGGAHCLTNELRGDG